MGKISGSGEKMKGFHLISLGLLAISLGVCLVVASAQDQLDGPDNNRAIQTARGRFVLPKIFDFELYKKLFHKTYNSLVQELARQKLFLAKALQAFISTIQYKSGNSDHYYGINNLSDKTPAELDRRTNRRNGNAAPHSDEPNDGAKIEVANEADVERAFEEILADQDKEPRLKEIAGQISRASGLSRRRRGTGRRDASLEDLIMPTVEVAKNEKLVNSVPTNNPDYEPVEVFSFGTTDGTESSEIPSQQANFINSLPGFQFVNSVRENLVVSFSGENRKQSAAKRNKTKTKSKVEKAQSEDVVYVDLRDSNCFLPAKDQGDCGSCYIFSTIGFLEWAHCKATGELVAFSEQYAIDCGFRAGLPGCTGGFEADVMNFVSKYGLELHRNYPYKATEATCPYARGTDPKVMGYMKLGHELKLDNVTTIDQIERTLRKYPLMATVNVPFDFGQYGGGVHPGEKCKDENGEHAMLLVGSGRQDGQEYWLFRNSYDTDWGEAGYFKLNKDSPCFVPAESLTSKSILRNFKFENPDYKAFRLTRAHDKRDPDAPQIPGEVVGPVNKKS